MKYAECRWTWRRGFSSPTISPTNNLPQSAFPFIILQNKNPAIQRITGFFIVFHQTFVEAAGVEPASKQGTRELSTCLAGRLVLLSEHGRRQPNPDPSLCVSCDNRGAYRTIS